MTELQILSRDEMISFDLPPMISKRDRLKIFESSDWVEEMISKLDRGVLKVGFILNYTYFMLCRKFYRPTDYPIEDIHFVAEQLGLNLEEINMVAYQNSSPYYKHKKLILNHCGYTSFKNYDEADLIKEEVDGLVKRMFRPKRILSESVRFLFDQKVEIPSFASLSKIISERIKVYEKTLLELIEKKLGQDEISLLNRLLDFEEEYYSKEKEHIKLKRYRLTSLKSPKYSIKVSLIRKTLKNHLVLKDAMEKLTPIIDELLLPLEVVQYYGTSVSKSDVFRVAIKESSQKYLYLICFVIHQFYRYQDTLTDILLKATRRMTNTASKDQSEQLLDKHKKDYKKIQKVVDLGNKNIITLTDIESLVQKKDLSCQEKLKEIEELLSQRSSQKKELKQDLKDLEKRSDRVLKNEVYYDKLKGLSVKLQLKVNEIVKLLIFSEEASDKKLISAINYFREKMAK